MARILPKTFFLIGCLYLFITAVKCWSYNPLCWVGECCNKDYITADTYALKRNLADYVYGQHLVDIVFHAISTHWRDSHNPRKALTFSFHGWGGTGKTYVSNFIAESLFKKGKKSEFVHFFVGRIHFPLEEHVQDYKANLYSWLKGNTSKCSKQLFIFDEVEKIPSGVLDAIKPVIDYRGIIDGVDYSQSIFIFISNTGSSSIQEHYLEYWKSGKRREDLELKDFDSIIMKGAFNEKGGFHHSDVIRSNLIDHYVPFLPLEEEHVSKCILDEFRKHNIHVPDKTHVREVLNFIQWGPDNLQIFSKSGCKRISSKVSSIVSKHYQFNTKQEL